MFEKPILNLVKFELEDIITASGGGEDDCPAYCATFDCPNDSSDMV